MRTRIVTVVVVALASQARASELDAVRRLLKDPTPSARAAAVRRLAGDSSRGTVQVVVDVMGDEHPYVRRAAAAVLGQVLDAKAQARARARVRRHRSPLLRAAACHAFAAWLNETGRAALSDALRDKHPSVRAAALAHLWVWAQSARDAGGEVASPAPTVEDVAAAARAQLEDRDGTVRASAADVLRAVPGALTGMQWIGMLRDADPRVRLVALEGSVVFGGEVAAVAIRHGLNDAVWSVQLTAAELARVTRQRTVLEMLPPHLGSKRQVVRASVHRALVELTGIPFEPDPAKWTSWLQGDGKSFDPAGVQPNRAKPQRPGTDTVVKALGVPIASNHVAFVLDTSGSMAKPANDGRSRWAGVCEELNRALASLSKRKTTVAVHCFSTDVRSLGPVALTAAGRGRIAAFLDAQQPGGRTALFDGIAAALRDPETDTVVVLSDGAPSAGTWFTKTDLLQGVRAANRFRRATVHVVAIGVGGIAKRWRDVLKRIAKAHGGTYAER